MRKRTAATALVGASVLIAGVLAVPTGAQASTAPKPVPNSKPAWTANATRLGAAPSRAAVAARVYLAPNGGLAALKQAVAAVSTPGSESYHHFLTVRQYQARYEPTTAQVDAVTSWLRSAGLRIKGVQAQHRFVAVRGTVSAAEAAFGTSLERFRRNGAEVWAPATALKVPASLAGDVLTVTGLDTSKHMVAPADQPALAPPAGYRNARPCSLYYGQLRATTQADYATRLPKFRTKYLSYAPCGYTGPQFRSAYEGSTALDGTGVTVAIVDAFAAPTIRTDANTYAKNHGDPAYTAGQFTQWTGKPFTAVNACGGNGWYGEETLDVEAVHAMAPAAKIRYYGAKNCEDSGLLGALGQVVQQNKAQVVTDSWGDLEQNSGTDTVRAYEQIFMQGAMQGISFMFSSGDDGDDLAYSGIKQAEYPTSDPYVTSVGGTSAAIGAAGHLQFQAGWGTDKYSLSKNGTKWQNDGFYYGAGGGTSALFNRPAYQNGVTSSPYRQIPDVSMDADPNTGMLVGETQKFSGGVRYDEYRIGGTSLASPLFAGMTALAVQKSGKGVGLLNPAIYAHAKSGAFTDVAGAPKQAGVVRVDFVNGENATGGLVYSVRTFGNDSSLRVRTGWDDVTGLGTPNSKYFSIYRS